MKKHEKKGART